jgi:glycosyltransferase involved in cell wall biosynthesis
MPFFSIGVTTYDREEMLIETLSSITSQTFSDFEVIVANDNPAQTVTGESLGISDPRIRFVNHPENLGEFENMNSLLRMSRGRYFTWLADDDLYAPEFLQTVHDTLVRFECPTCAFTSFRDMSSGVEPQREQIQPENIAVLSGREFLRKYLAHELKAIGVMGFFDRTYLERTGGLEDVSADGQGLYCEYMLIIRAGLLDRIAYIDVPLVYFRIHEATWLLAKSNVEQYQRASINLVSRSVDCFCQPQLLADFDQNLVNILKWFMFDVIIASRRMRPFRLPQFVRFLSFAKGYIASLSGSAIYGRARRCLLKAEIWVGWALFKQTFLARAPQPMIRFAYSVKALLPEDRISNAASGRKAVTSGRP